jgi:hypothetical protein
MARPFTKPPAHPDNRISNEILIYQAEDGSAVTEVRLEADTLWMTQAQIADLFGTKRPAITKHLSNIFKSAELDKSSVCSILERTAADNKSYKTQYYNLDAILSVGYRVNSVNVAEGSELDSWILSPLFVNMKQTVRLHDCFHPVVWFWI